MARRTQRRKASEAADKEEVGIYAHVLSTPAYDLIGAKIEAALGELARCEFTTANCAGLDIASRRVRSVAQPLVDELARIREVQSGGSGFEDFVLHRLGVTIDSLRVVERRVVDGAVRDYIDGKAA